MSDLDSNTIQKRNVVDKVLHFYTVFIQMTDPMELCVHCDHLKLHPDDDWEHVFVRDDDTCCVKHEYARHFVAYVRNRT